jgi:hypothetical protein
MPSLDHIFKSKVNLHLEVNCIKNNFVENTKSNSTESLHDLVESIKLFYKNELQKIVYNTGFFFNIITKKLEENNSETFNSSECEIILGLIDSYIIKSKSFVEFILIRYDNYHLFKGYKDILDSLKNLNTIFCNLIEHHLNIIHNILTNRRIVDNIDYQTLTQMFETIRDILTNF